MKDMIHYKPVWTIRKYANDAAFNAGQHFAEEVFEGNLLLNEGIALLLALLTGGAGTAFTNAAAFIGVGSTNTAAAATQTGLLAATPTYVGMQPGYPQISGQTVTFRAVFDGNTANHAWQEFTVANGNSNSAVNLNRRVSDQGTKASGQTWTLDLQITWS